LNLLNPQWAVLLYKVSDPRERLDVNTTVVCPFCGQVSSDHEFCDGCNREIPVASVAVDSPPSSVQLIDGRLIDCSSWSDRWPASPESFVVVSYGDRKVRLHGISPEIWPRCREAVEERERVRLPALAPITIAQIGGGAVVVADCSESAVRTDATCCDLHTDGAESRVNAVVQRCRQLHGVLQELHLHGFVWLTFDPEAIERSAQVVRITNLDLALFPIGRCPGQLAVSPSYSPPEVCRFQAEKIGPATDVFQLALFAYFSLGNMIPGGFPGLGLEAFRFELPALRVYWPELPLGIWPVLRKALRAESTDRYPTTAEFIDDLQRAADRASERAQRHAPLRRAPRRTRLLEFLRKQLSKTRASGRVGRNIGTVIPVDLGYCTMAGLAKNDARNQDAVDVFQLPGYSSALQFAIVADGVSTARLGTGDLASGIACRVIRNVIERETDSGLAAQPWEVILSQACVEASEAIVATALSLPNHPEDVRDNDVMSTTSLVGVVDDDSLHLANVGDSRAYLIREGIAEQMTVDGDVACSLLRELKPPEEVQELGIQAKALRNCLGACEYHENGTLGCDRLRSTPHYASWRILPGETVVLCSDGLIEEGVFLEPEDLGRIVFSQQHRTAQEIADLLVNESNGRQRPRTETEPSGFGDNITCVVMRFGTMPVA
jgi:serine/threonine protein phosphatase PrpC